MALAGALGRPSVLRVPAPVLRLAIGEMADAVLTGQRAIPAKMIAAKHSFAFGRLEDALAAILRG
jgi:NAD dependent epimerase/dehydratase family enzyme